ncbi:hypothetical protein MBM09_04180 [Flaviramulus sp. BrNp1-15]|uniref:hypothetical protein n=1 Tax=Flaviramulus sp. BrNp1-15 TaxID=2916754 RepID=UPI001EE8F777|nr:hypothetical protein [Flaviramulus sp. BrNp1-15]ULC60189.1 hypothetical protein MBM09_04180 [Flaviramulus sp. BrNp1-15]
MQVFKKLLSFYIHSSIHVALSVYSLTWITLIEYGLPYDENVLYFIFYASITGYNFVKYFGVAKFHHRSLTNWLKIIQIFSFFSFVLMCYYAFQLSTKTLYYIVSFGVITFLYAIPFLPKRLFVDSKHNLRSIGGLKIYLIALVWSGVTVFLPLIENNYSINDDVILTGIQRFIFIIVLMLPFEIRDLSYDSLKLSTVPQKIGVKQTKGVGMLLLLIFFFLEFFKNEISEVTIGILLLITILTLLFLIFSKVNQGKYYSALWVEGLPIVWLLLVLYFY